MSEDRFVFTVEWFDSAAALVRTYHLTYFTKDKTIEMVAKRSCSSTSRTNASSSSDASMRASS